MNHQSRLNRQNLRRAAFLFSVLVLSGASLSNVQATESASATQASDLALAKAEMNAFFAAVEGIHDYTHVMSKQQRVKGNLQPEEVMAIKHRQSPECRYMKWIGERKQGREMIYCADRYQGEIQAHDSGVLSFYHASFKPDGALYQRTGQLHPIDEVGLYSMAKLIRKDYDALLNEENQGQGDQGKGDQSSTESIAPHITQARIAGADSTCIDLAKGADLFSTYHAGRREVCLDNRLHLPTSLKIWDQQGQLMEQYTFSEYKLNVGLSDADFDTGNKAYRF